MDQLQGEAVRASAQAAGRCIDEPRSLGIAINLEITIARLDQSTGDHHCSTSPVVHQYLGEGLPYHFHRLASRPEHMERAYLNIQAWKTVDHGEVSWRGRACPLEFSSPEGPWVESTWSQYEKKPWQEELKLEGERRGSKLCRVYIGSVFWWASTVLGFKGQTLLFCLDNGEMLRMRACVPDKNDM